MKKGFFLIVVFSVLFSCGKEKEKNVVYYDINDFPQTSSLQGTTIDLGELQNPTGYELINDSILLITNNRTPKILEVRNLNNNQILLETVTKGRGPNEFLTGNIFIKNYNHPEFYLIDVLTNHFAEINIDTLLKQKDKYIFKKMVFPIHTQEYSITTYDSTSFIAQNKYYIDNSKYSNHVEPFVVFNPADTANILKEEPYKKYRYWVTNVSDSYIFINENKNLLWNISKDKDNIYIYNKKELTLQKKLVGPYHFKINYQTNNNDGLIEIADVGYHSAFRGFVYDENYVYLLFNNANYEKYTDKPAGNTNKSEIYKYTWEGDLVHRYILDQNAYTLSMDSKKEYFYCSVSANYMGRPDFVKYKIP